MSFKRYAYGKSPDGVSPLKNESVQTKINET